MKKSNMLKTLRMQIALHYLKASGVILLLMGGILYYSISSVVLSEATSSTKTAVEKSGMYIDLYIERLKAVSALLAENPQLVSYFSTTERDPSYEAKFTVDDSDNDDNRSIYSIGRYCEQRWASTFQ
ncbi:hypothetical protein LSPH24S_05937 [Lysinibacillus sphaericus]